jgi:hypothetical protein
METPRSTSVKPEAGKSWHQYGQAKVQIEFLNALAPVKFS